ncbi:hypothetical protein ACXWP3_09705, partial [Streptococcus pyogenes]
SLPVESAVIQVPPAVAPAVDKGPATERLLQQTLDLLTQAAIPAALRMTEKDASAAPEARAALKSALEALQKREQAWLEG